MYTALYAGTLLMSTCGPLFDAFMFLYHGNNWSVATLQTVMLVGMVRFSHPLPLPVSATRHRVVGPGLPDSFLDAQACTHVRIHARMHRRTRLRAPGMHEQKRNASDRRP